MISWLPAALLSLFSFGLWGLFSKLSLNYIDSRSALIFQTVGVLLIGLFVLFGTSNFKLATDGKGLGFALLTGIAYSLGCFLYLIAADKGKISTVVTLTALYPLITLVLSFIFLREEINLKQCTGIIFALVAIYFMAG
jgi:transporter family protein